MSKSDLVVLDCSVGEGGGGILRAAIPLAIKTGRSVFFKNFRINKPEPGIGCTHKWLLQHVCNITGSRSDKVEFGATDFVFYPNTCDENVLSYIIDFDIPENTTICCDIHVVRDLFLSSDTFTTKINNINGKAVKGHSIVTPLIAIIPCLSNDFNCTLIGGTEVPGAPFVDAFNTEYIKLFNSIGYDFSIDVISRGVLGLGGGMATFKFSKSHSFVNSFNDCIHLDVQPTISCRIYVFGNDCFWDYAQNAYSILLKDISNSIEHDIKPTFIFQPYSHNKLQAIFFISDGFHTRDITICNEESDNQMYFNTFKALSKKRLQSELTYSNITSRFVVEQILPYLSVLPDQSTIFTESITPHIKSVVAVIEALTNRKILIERINGRIYRVVVE